MTLQLDLRTQIPGQDDHGYFVWKPHIQSTSVGAAETALVICDMWDRNWSRAANERVVPLSRRIASVANKLRLAGGTIIHAPSDTMAYYHGHPARERAAGVPLRGMPPMTNRSSPPLPIDDSDGGSDSNDGGELIDHQTWSCQIDLIPISEEKDYISDDGSEIWSIFEERNLRWILLCGVHANMCILDRTFGIRNMVSRGVPIVLLRDLTDAMYNPAMPPYVDHDQGTELMVHYIEKFWCPTISAAEIFT